MPTNRSSDLDKTLDDLSLDSEKTRVFLDPEKTRVMGAGETTVHYGSEMVDDILPTIQWTPGARVSGRYLIKEILGQGGMGVVAIADDLLLRKQVALKALLPELTRNPANVELFLKEVAIAHAITHPGIIRTFDLGEDQGVYYFSMEYIDGEMLEDKLQRMGGKLPVDEVRRIALAICHALEAAHKAGVVHRDLKPSNIMLVNDHRQVVLMDFGISGFVGSAVEHARAQSRAGEGSMWMTSAGFGTPAYMSPEQCHRAPITPASDLYSLGVILFQCLTGRPVFQKSTVTEFLDAHVSEPPPRLRSVDPTLPKEFDELIARCLDKEPSTRLSSARAAAEILEPNRTLIRSLEWTARALVIGLVLASIGYGVYAFARSNIIQEMRPALYCLAQSTASQIDPRDLDTIHGEQDVGSEAFQRVRRLLLATAEQYPQIRYIYTVRAAADWGGSWEYVVDKDPETQDSNGNGVIDEGEQGTKPGETWDSSLYPAAKLALRTGKPTADTEFALEKGWGMLLSGYARIGDRDGKGGYIVGVDASHTRLVRFRNILIIVFVIAWLSLLLLPRLVIRPLLGRAPAHR